MYFDSNFEQRLTNLTQVVNKDHPLQKQDVLELAKRGGEQKPETEIKDEQLLS